MVEKKVKIVLETKVKSLDGVDKFELTTFGTVHQKADSLYVRYKEQTLEGEVSNTLKYNGKDLTLIRSGILNTRQTFQPGLETYAVLQSSAGPIHLKTKTHRVCHQQDETKNTETLHFSYDLEAQLEPIGLYELTLTATEIL